MIIEEYDESLFISRFEDYKRVETETNKNGNFTYKGLRHLFQYLNEIYDEENPLTLDVISLCCDFNEYKNLNEYLTDYSNQHEVLNFEGFLNEKCPTLLKEYETYKKESIKNGVNLAEDIYKWVAYILKKEDIINEFETKQEEFKNQIEEEINDKSTLIKFGDDLDEGFIIQAY